MPTSKKRLGFIPREDVLKIIDMLSIENNLSNSKIISILVEEALSIRGILNKKNNAINQLYQLNNTPSQKLSDNTADLMHNENLSIDTELGDHIKSSKSTYANEVTQEAFDVETYKKFLSFLKFKEMMDKYKT